MQNDLYNSLELVLDQLDQKLQSYVYFKKCIRTYSTPCIGAIDVRFAVRFAAKGVLELVFFY
jgi:hypothetical protein